MNNINIFDICFLIYNNTTLLFVFVGAYALAIPPELGAKYSRGILPLKRSKKASHTCGCPLFLRAIGFTSPFMY